MKIVDFREMAIVESEDVQVVNVTLKLDELLDEPFTKFIEVLEAMMLKVANALKEREESDFNIKIKTDLSDDDLEMVRENIINAFCQKLVNRDKLKREEYRLGLPVGLVDVDILYLSLMEITNFETIIDRFTIELYNKNDEFYDDILRKEE
jgi:hypothetical protein